jgi:hypothetical protein
MERRLRQPLGGRLRNAEVDDLRHGPAVLKRHEDVRGLEIPVDDPLLVGVLHTLAGLDEEPQALGHREALPGAVVADGEALDELHGEEGASVGRGAGVEDVGDVGVVEERQGLALGLEAGDDLLGVHAELDELQCDAAADGEGLIGEEDLAHAAFADLLQQAEGTDGHGGGGRGGLRGERALGRLRPMRGGSTHRPAPRNESLGPLAGPERSERDHEPQRRAEGRLVRRRLEKVRAGARRVSLGIDGEVLPARRPSTAPDTCCEHADGGGARRPRQTKHARIEGFIGGSSKACEGA